MSPTPRAEHAVIEEPSTTWVGQYDTQFARKFRWRVWLNYQQVIIDLLREAEIKPGERVLDITAEDAALALQLVPRVAPGQLISVCPMEEVLQEAYFKAKAAGLEDKIDWRIAPIEALPFPDDSFDAITCCSAFRLLDIKAFVAEAYRLLVPGGRLIVAESLVPRTQLTDWRLALRRVYHRYISKDQAEAEAEFYSADELADVLQKTGFKPIMIRGLQKPLTQHSWVFSLIKATKYDDYQ
jgi:demethylmenaquinone methyltransferase/2-methoxy-6-polyprenyl-1,4-benzoquinol methylase